MEKIIFLDIDGVLTTVKEYWLNRTNYRKKYPEAARLNIPYPFNKKCVQAYNNIILATGADVVLSSDWRLHWSLDELDEIFKFNGCIKSPSYVTHNEMVSMSGLEKNRAYQIESFIIKHKPKKWVAIDDLDMREYMKITGDDDKMIVTNDNEGIKQTGIKEKIIKLLN